VVEGRHRSCFLLEAEAPRLVAQQGIGKNFESNVTAEAGIARPVDLSHAAGTYSGKDFVGTEPRPNRYTHRLA
jgi:hypothetical protein